MTGAIGLALLLNLGGEPPPVLDETSERPMMTPASIPSITWTAEERATLSGGQPVSRHWRDTDGRARGLSAAVVSAPAPSVWAQVVDLDAYVKFLPYVTASHTDRVEPRGDHTLIIGGYQLTTMGVTTRYRLDNRWYVDRDVLVFDIASEGAGPIDTGDGWWRVTPWEGPGGQVLLEYSVDLAMRWWVPSFLERRAADRLPVLVRLMKQRAEAVGG